VTDIRRAVPETRKQFQAYLEPRNEAPERGANPVNIYTSNDSNERLNNRFLSTRRLHEAEALASGAGHSLDNWIQAQSLLGGKNLVDQLSTSLGGNVRART
jgi:hypothetical protein